MSRRLWVVVGGAGHFTSQFLQRLALCLGDKQGGEDAAKHEESENLHNMVQPWRCVIGSYMALCSQRSKDSLRNNSSHLTRCGGDTVRGRAVSSGEAFSWNNESGGVRAEVEEELGQDVKRQQTIFTEMAVSEADDDENDRQKSKSHELNWFPTNGIDCGDGDPVTWDSTCANNDQIADSGIAENVIHGSTLRITNGTENDRVVETKTVEGDIQKEPRSCSSEKDLSMSPLAVVTDD